MSTCPERKIKRDRLIGNSSRCLTSTRSGWLTANPTLWPRGEMSETGQLCSHMQHTWTTSCCNVYYIIIWKVKLCQYWKRIWNTFSECGVCATNSFSNKLLVSHMVALATACCLCVVLLFSIIFKFLPVILSLSIVSRIRECTEY